MCSWKMGLDRTLTEKCSPRIRKAFIQCYASMMIFDMDDKVVFYEQPNAIQERPTKGAVAVVMCDLNVKS